MRCGDGHVHQAEALDRSERPVFGRRRMILARKHAFQGQIGAHHRQ